MIVMIFATAALIGGAAQPTPPPASAPAADYPHCSRSVTDHCTQGGGMGHATHHMGRGHHGRQGHHGHHGHHGHQGHHH